VFCRQLHELLLIFGFDIGAPLTADSPATYCVPVLDEMLWFEYGKSFVEPLPSVIVHVTEHVFTLLLEFSALIWKPSGPLLPLPCNSHLNVTSSANAVPAIRQSAVANTIFIAISVYCWSVYRKATTNPVVGV
jgi:hypothetical protein